MYNEISWKPCECGFGVYVSLDFPAVEDTDFIVFTS